MEKYVFDVRLIKDVTGQISSYLWSFGPMHTKIDIDKFDYLLDKGMSCYMKATFEETEKEMGDFVIEVKEGKNCCSFIHRNTLGKIVYFYSDFFAIALNNHDEKKHYYKVTFKNIDKGNGSDSEEAKNLVPATSVSHPSHYRRFGMECIDAMVKLFGKEEVKSFCKLNAFKYRWRAGDKGDEKEDIDKAEWYEKYMEEKL